MSLTYPIATSALEALTEPLGTARTQTAARRLADRPVSFETEWLKPEPEQAGELAGAVERAVASGAAQIYEGEAGRPVIALNYWQIQNESTTAPVEPPPQPTQTPAQPEEKPADHADDLYFRHGRTKKRKPKPVDPNQMDLFGGSRPAPKG